MLFMIQQTLYPSGTHIAEVEVDPATGVVQVVDWAACDDFGNLVNPMIVEGQVHGGIAQGIGQALLEDAHYDCLLYTSPSPRDLARSRMPSSA